MQAAFIVSFLANLILTLVSHVILPQRVATHFGPGGAPDAWASSTSNTLLMLAMHSLLFCGLYFSPVLISKVPAKWINLPDRDYWLTPERLPRMVEMLSHFVRQYGTALFLFMFLVGLLALRANLSAPVRLDEGALLATLAIFLAYTAYWLIALVRAFRLPERK